MARDTRNVPGGDTEIVPRDTKNVSRDVKIASHDAKIAPRDVKNTHRSVKNTHHSVENTAHDNAEKELVHTIKSHIDEDSETLDQRTVLAVVDYIRDLLY